jgi:hypothetical protein
LLQDADRGHVRERLRQPLVLRGHRAGAPAEQVKPADRLLAQPQRKRRHGPESGLERERGEQRPAHAVSVEITADDRRTGADAVQARPLVVLQLEDLEQPGFLTRGRDDGEVALQVVEQQPGGRDVQQADTRRGQPVEQVDDVVVFDEAVREHHERVGQFLLAAEDVRWAERFVSGGHGPSTGKRRRRSTTSRATSATGRPTAKA